MRGAKVNGSARRSNGIKTAEKQRKRNLGFLARECENGYFQGIRETKWKFTNDLCARQDRKTNRQLFVETINHADEADDGNDEEIKIMSSRNPLEA
jgi:hypothetical protein